MTSNFSSSHLKILFYSFRLKIGLYKSQPKQFSIDPSTTILQVKSIILPRISSKRLEILFDNEVLNDYNSNKG